MQQRFPHLERFKLERVPRVRFVRTHCQSGGIGIGIANELPRWNKAHRRSANSSSFHTVVTIKPGGLRELHWHPTASEWQFWIAGKGTMTVFFPYDNARTVDVNANDVAYVPSNAPHYIENTGAPDLVFLETFAFRPLLGCFAELVAASPSA